MLNTLLIGIKVILDTFQQDVQKRYQLVKPKGSIGFAVYSVTIAFFSLLLYGLAAGFNLKVNAATLEYAGIYAIFVGINFVLPFIVLKYTNMVATALFSRVGSLFVIVFFSFAFLHEALSISSVLGAVFMLVAVLLPMFQKREQSSGSVKGYLWGALLSVVTGICTIINKLYAISTASLGSNAAYCFYVNVFILLAWCVYSVFVGLSPDRRRATVDTVKEFTKPVFTLILISTLASAINTLFNLYAFSFINLSYYTVITSSASLILIAIISKVKFKENLNRYSYASIFLALVAIVLTVA